MAFMITMIVLDRPYLNARLYGETGIHLTGDDGDTIGISVGNGEYAREVVSILNQLADRYRDDRREEALGQVRRASLRARWEASLALEEPRMAAE